MSRLKRFGALALAFTLLSAGTAAAVVYTRPVDAPITDEFRAPKHKYGPGNRGWEYKTTPGTPIKVAAPGTITFAGQVGGVLNVVLKHEDGIRTTYSRLQSIAVRKGDRLEADATVGIAGPNTFFGARCRNDYIDPKTLFDVRVYLVPLDGRGSGNDSQNC